MSIERNKTLPNCSNMDGLKRTLCLVKLFKHKYYMSHLQSKNNTNKHIQQNRNRFTETKNSDYQNGDGRRGKLGVQD